MCDSTNCLVPGPARPRHRPQWSLRCFAATLGGLIFLSTSAASIALTQAAAPSLGRVHFPISCTARSQHEFERAVALLHHMTYPEARYAFRAIADAEPRCAMAYWGVAMTLFQPLWPTRPDLRALQEGWEATQKAKSLEPPTPRERAFVAAAEAFFIEPGSPDYWLRIRRWEQAQERVYAAYPDDPEAAV